MPLLSSWLLHDIYTESANQQGYTGAVCTSTVVVPNMDAGLFNTTVNMYIIISFIASTAYVSMCQVQWIHDEN